MAEIGEPTRDEPLIVPAPVEQPRREPAPKVAPKREPVPWELAAAVAMCEAEQLLWEAERYCREAVEHGRGLA